MKQSFRALLAGLFIIWRLFRFILFGKPRSNAKQYLHGSARSMSRREIRQILSKRNRGVCIDGRRMLDLESSYCSLLVVGKPGCGKSSTMILGTLLRQDKGNSLIISDPSGELLERSSGYLYHNGYDVRAIDIRSLENTHTYNPMNRISSDNDILILASAIIDASNPPATVKDPFWTNSAKSLLYCIIKCLLNRPKQYQNLPNIRHAINGYGKRGEGLINFFAENAIEDRTFAEVKAFLSQSENVSQSVLSTARSSLSCFIDEQVSRLVSSDTLSFDDVRKQPVAIFLVFPEDLVEPYSFLLTIFFRQLLDLLNRMPEPDDKPVLLLLDEFCNIGRINNMARTLTTIRKRKVSLTLIVQSLEQIKAVYGKEADATTAACNTQIYFPGLDIQTCELLSRTLGRGTLQIMEEGHHKAGANPDSYRNTTIGRELLTAQEIRTLTDEILMLYGNKPPALLKTTPYYKQSRLHQRSLIECPSGINESPSPVCYLHL